MHNYILADLSRIVKRIPRIAVMLITFGVFCAAVAIYVSIVKLFNDPMIADEAAELGLGIVYSENTVYNAIRQMAGYAVGIIGLFELIFVFSDDIRAKTTQIAIGLGINRTKVVISKFLELVILLFTDFVILLGLSLLMGLIMGSPLNAAQITELAKTLSIGILLKNVGYCSIVFILIFTTQSMMVAILAYLALNFHVVSNLIGLADYVKVLQKLHLDEYTLTHFVGRIEEIAAGAKISLIPFAGCAVYIVVSLLITSILFKKKELEF